MKTFSELKTLAERMVRITTQSKYPCKIYMCSAKIGKPLLTNQFGYFNAQTKYIVTYPKSALEEVQTIINGFVPEVYVEKGKDYRSTRNMYGLDLYTNVSSLHPYLENAISSKKSNEIILRAEIERWMNQQVKAFAADNPKLNEHDILTHCREIEAHFRKVVLYLRSLNDPNALITIRRLSGTQHKIQIKPNTHSKRVSYSNLLIAVGCDEALPEVVTASETRPKLRADSIEQQSKTNPEAFKYYDKFGIFEVFDK